MKKHIAVLALLAVLVAGAAAQTHNGVGLGLQTTTIKPASGSGLATTALALNFDNVAGKTVCIVTSAAISMPSTIKEISSNGTVIVEGKIHSDYNVRLATDILMGLGYRSAFGPAEIVLGAGVAMSTWQNTSSQYPSAGGNFLFFNLGFGGLATAALNLGDSLQLYGGVRYVYAPYTILQLNLDGVSFVATTLTPHVGLRIRTR